MDFKTIPVECQPAYTWLWNSTITKPEIKRQIEEMYDAGIRAFYVLGEPENFRPNRRRTHLAPEYLSDEYIDLVYYAYQVASAKGMYTWLYNEGGFPSGMACGKIRREHPELAMKVCKVEKKLLKAGEVLEETDGFICAYKGTERIARGESFSQDIEVTLYRYEDESFNTIQTDNASLQNTKYFLEYTHARLKERFGEHMGTAVTMMFDDESYMGTWTEGMDDIFYKKYGYELQNYMPFLFGGEEPQTKAQYQARSDYYMLCGELVRENYFKTMRLWLNEHHMESVGHLDNDHISDQAVKNRYGNVLQTLREFDVPGIDVIWSQIAYPVEGRSCNTGNEYFPRAASSAARQKGSSMCLSESFAVYGAYVNPDLMRYVVNYQAVRGISLYNFMVISYDRKTPMSLQYRPNFIGENPGMDCLSQINEYTARISAILQKSKAKIDTAVYVPYRSICACGRIGTKACRAVDGIGHSLEKLGIEFDLVDEEFIRNASVEEGCLKGEYVSYKNVLVPQAELECEDVAARLEQMGRIELPEEFLPEGGILSEEKVLCYGAVLPRASVVRENSRLMSRELLFEDGSRGWLICNTDGMIVKENIGLSIDVRDLEDGRGFYLVEIQTGEICKAEYTIEDNMVRIPLCLLKGDGCLIWLPEDAEFVPECVSHAPSLLLKSCKLSDRMEEVCEITEISSYVSRKYELHPIQGPENFFYESGEEREGLYEWPADFSGEVTYRLVLPVLPLQGKGEYYLNLGEVRHYAKVYRKGVKLAETTMAPYRVALPEPVSGEEVTVVVANTIANACSNTDYFTVQDIRDVGPYHENMIKRERMEPAGGLLGPVRLERIKE